MSQQRQRKETRWLDVGTMAVWPQCHVGCDSCSHTGNILRVAKCATGRKCCSGRVGEKDDQVRYPLVTFFPKAVETLGPLSDEAHSLIAEIGRRATLCTADPWGNYVPVPTYFSGNSAFQRSVPCQHVHSFRVPIVTIPDIHFYFC